MFFDKSNLGKIKSNKKQCEHNIIIYCYVIITFHNTISKNRMRPNYYYLNKPIYELRFPVAVVYLLTYYYYDYYYLFIIIIYYTIPITYTIIVAAEIVKNY